MKYLIDRRTGKRVPHANLSRFHPVFGMTMAEHEVAKAKRAAGKLPFEPISQRRAKGRMTAAARALAS